MPKALRVRQSRSWAPWCGGLWRPALVVGWLLTGWGCEADPPRQVVIRAGRLLDGTGAPALANQLVVIRSGVITAMGPDDPARLAAYGPDTEVIEARALTVLPGLVSAVARADPPAGKAETARHGGSAAWRRRLEAFSQSGVTSVAMAGLPLSHALALRRYVGTGRQRGPRLFVAGALLGGREPITDLARRRMVAQQVVAGVDFVALDGAAEPAGGAKRQAQATAEAMCSWVVAAHFYEAQAVLLASEVQPQLRALAKSCGGEKSVAVVQARPLEEDFVAAVVAEAAGGTAAAEVIRQVTWEAAQALGLGDALGRLAPGYRGDIIAVEGRPDEQLSDLRRLQWMLIDGAAQQLAPAPWYRVVWRVVALWWGRLYEGVLGARLR